MQLYRHQVQMQIYRHQVQLQLLPPPGARFSKDPTICPARKVIFWLICISKRKHYIDIKLCMELS